MDFVQVWSGIECGKTLKQHLFDDCDSISRILESLNTNNIHQDTIMPNIVCLCALLIFVNSFNRFLCDQFTVGYLTGSSRLPGNIDYQRPGLMISGAITLAVEEINRDHRLFGNHTLGFIVAETYGEETVSIRRTAQLKFVHNVSAYIGPQETCVVEARMAASFNLPMLSYVSVLYLLLHQSKYYSRWLGLKHALRLDITVKLVS